MDCWKEAARLRRLVRDMVRKFPPEEKFRLTDQLIRSSRSAPANIAEGFGRFTFQENSRYCWIARGSLCETLDHIIVAQEEGFIDDEKLSLLRKQVDLSLALLNGYINYLQKGNRNAKSDSQGTLEPESIYVHQHPEQLTENDYRLTPTERPDGYRKSDNRQQRKKSHPAKFAQNN